MDTQTLTADLWAAWRILRRDTSLDTALLVSVAVLPILLAIWWWFVRRAQSLRTQLRRRRRR